jgi:putative restriction endonuclease
VDVEAERDLRRRIILELSARLTETGGTITRPELSHFPLGQGDFRRLIDQSRGIWNPRDLSGTLSVVSDPGGSYADRHETGGLFRYSYRAGSAAGDNTKLRRAMQLGLPMILLRKLEPNLFMPVLPVYVVADDEPRHEFVLILDAEQYEIADPLHLTPSERRYAERVMRHRLHQPEFRIRVLRAYEIRCTVCSLRHREFLDAAHIIGDREERGDPVVPNGLSLCKIHHAAYDEDLMGISPDGKVAINRELLEEIDGPMLQHGLQAMHGRSIAVPRRRTDRPDPDRLDRRYQRFLAA